MMSNRRDGTLYVGVASDLPRRAFNTARVSLMASPNDMASRCWSTMNSTMTFELQFNAKRRANIGRGLGRLRLIHRANPDWKDLYDTLF